MVTPSAPANSAPAECVNALADDDRETLRRITLSKVSDRTMHELEFVLEAIKDCVVELTLWNQTFLATMCFKGTVHEERGRAMTEGLSKTLRVNWCVMEPNDTKWNKDNARELTYTSVFL